MFHLLVPGGRWQTVIEMPVSFAQADLPLLHLLHLLHQKYAFDRFMSKLSFEMAFTPTEIYPDIYPKIRGKKDYPILSSAILADVDVFITGDMLLPLYSCV